MKQSTSHPALTPERLADIRRVRALVELEKDAIIARGREIANRFERIRQTIEALKTARQAKGLTLDDVAQRTGIAKPNLSRLENNDEPNPTIDTLLRIADAVGVDLLKAG